MSARKVRFAPSPNGFLHLGHAYSALRNDVCAREAGDEFLLRIEDIDRSRARPHFESAIFEDLAWLGLEWRTPVRRQSKHLEDYAHALDRLRQSGLLYPCFCSRGDIACIVAEKPDWPHDPDGAPLYPGTCRGQHANRESCSRPLAWRLDMAAALPRVSGPLNLQELTWREYEEGAREQIIAARPQDWGDVILGRRDVPTSYHLSVVVDDALQEITDVVRGRDLFFATSIHRLLQVLLDLPEPIYRHHKLLLDGDGRKLSKSERAPALRDLRAGGTTAQDVRAQLGFA